MGKEYEKLIKKISDLDVNTKLDLSADEDLSIAIMNLISIEEHLFFTGAKTGKASYYEILNEVREVRKSLLKRIIKDYEGEIWCTSKHLLAASYRLIEYGTKLQSEAVASNTHKTKDAVDIFEKAYGLYSLFWFLNLGNDNKE
ncbi:MAG: hypothetical protein US52_C0033G0005 [candidate division WS6 bacterium GW2011_GWA2_37_6]|uniref:Uncharacterized protein n=1 Tax=candidate division WS6 bacterium GW2011_GWA2_37_6 TaxID=1619087 RepID=A0A0G0GW04_9BACT|nr:MAG: hypothetical protein US52_C0033G0005 [candidate division WS6 bacterium GW2011_GWA2_37_6]